MRADRRSTLSLCKLRNGVYDARRRCESSKPDSDDRTAAPCNGIVYGKSRQVSPSIFSPKRLDSPSKSGNASTKTHGDQRPTFLRPFARVHSMEPTEELGHARLRSVPGKNFHAHGAERTESRYGLPTEIFDSLYHREFSTVCSLLASFRGPFIRAERVSPGK